MNNNCSYFATDIRWMNTWKNITQSSSCIGRIYHGVVTNVLDCDIVQSSFESQSRYCVNFWANALDKGMNLWGLKRRKKTMAKNRIKISKSNSFPRSPLTECEIGACLKRGASWRQRETLPELPRDATTERTFFSLLLVGRVCASWVPKLAARCVSLISSSLC